MVQIVWTRKALDNIEEIKAYISLSSDYYAGRLITQIFKSVQVLAQHPESGRMVQERKDYVLRRLLVKSYRIIYRYKNNKVEIIALYHQSRSNADPFEPIDSDD